jgi:hypothetical protein
VVPHADDGAACVTELGGALEEAEEKVGGGLLKGHLRHALGGNEGVLAHVRAARGQARAADARQSDERCATHGQPLQVAHIHVLREASYE